MFKSLTKNSIPVPDSYWIYSKFLFISLELKEGFKKISLCKSVFLTFVCVLSVKPGAVSSVGISEIAINVNGICFSPSLP